MLSNKSEQNDMQKNNANECIGVWSLELYTASSVGAKMTVWYMYNSNEPTHVQANPEMYHQHNLYESLNETTIRLVYAHHEPPTTHAHRWLKHVETEKHNKNIEVEWNRDKTISLWCALIRNCTLNKTTYSIASNYRLMLNRSKKIISKY